MALAHPLRHASKRASKSLSVNRVAVPACGPSLLHLAKFQRASRTMATVVPPVTQDATSSKGPTAMVFMNMGGPSTTDEVGDFLSRLFVRTFGTS